MRETDRQTERRRRERERMYIINQESDKYEAFQVFNLSCIRVTSSLDIPRIGNIITTHVIRETHRCRSDTKH